MIEFCANKSLDAAFAIRNQCDIDEIEKVVQWCLEQIDNPFHTFRIATQLLEAKEYQRAFQISLQLLDGIGGFFVNYEENLEKKERLEKLESLQKTLAKDWKSLEAAELKQLRELRLHLKIEQIRKPFLESEHRLDELFSDFAKLTIKCSFECLKDLKKKQSKGKIEESKVTAERNYIKAQLMKLKNQLRNPNHFLEIIKLINKSYSGIDAEVILDFGSRAQEIIFQIQKQRETRLPLVNQIQDIEKERAKLLGTSSVSSFHSLFFLQIFFSIKRTAV